MKTDEELIGKTVEKFKEFKFPEKQQLLRTTLRFSRKGHEAIKKLSKLQGKKIADTFDVLIDTYKILGEKNEDFSGFVNKEVETIRKTYIIRKNTLSKITELAKKNGIPRDKFIDAIAIILLLVAENKAYIEHEKHHDALFDIINPFWEYAEGIEKKLEEKLGMNDPVVSRFSVILIHIMELSNDIDEFLSKGTPIEP